MGGNDRFDPLRAGFAVDAAPAGAGQVGGVEVEKRFAAAPAQAAASYETEGRCSANHSGSPGSQVFASISGGSSSLIEPTGSKPPPALPGVIQEALRPPPPVPPGVIPAAPPTMRVMQGLLTNGPVSIVNEPGAVKLHCCGSASTRRGSTSNPPACRSASLPKLPIPSGGFDGVCGCWP